MPSFVSEFEIPKTQTALVVSGPGKAPQRKDASVPILAPDMALVKTVCVAVNPVDAKMLDYSPAVGAINGHDFAGIIVELGKEAPSHLALGDRVAGVVHGNNALGPKVGAFGQYIGAIAELLLKIPEDWTFEEASTLGLGVATAGFSLFRELKIPITVEDMVKRASQQPQIPQSKAPFVLVSGGSTATGYRPLATCSPSNYELVRGFGAEQVFDYRNPDCAAEIRTYTRNGLAYALDCISEADSSQLCYAAIGRAGGRYCALEPFRQGVAASRPTVKASWLMVLTMFGGRVALDGEYGREAQPADRVFAARIFSATQALLDRDLVRSHPVEVIQGGWAGVERAIEVIRTRAVSGKKLVVRVD